MSELVESLFFERDDTKSMGYREAVGHCDEWLKEPLQQLEVALKLKKFRFIKAMEVLRGACKIKNAGRG